ncbi:MAG: polysaccharide biosynthesis/export family protein [Bacteroidetes bacterium]|nr:polysaccharide biosynthesis/export family protein [Bacteroidota bacterium]
MAVKGGEDATGLASAVGYLVDVNGNIEMPLIGKIKLGGLTTSQATDLIKTKLEKFLQSPSVRLYFENYRVTILGEVIRPGVYQVPNEKITLPGALGLAGDLTPFGKRDNILIVREEGDKNIYEVRHQKQRCVFIAILLPTPK